MAIFQAWETFLQEAESDSQACNDVASVLSRQVRSGRIAGELQFIFVLTVKWIIRVDLCHSGEEYEIEGEGRDAKID